ncbi:hypothetical protein B0H34DRAFT_712562 [Crassisporium funariophilum]|nr:hypothetical protein B0H34DRAFT_712562 [Crassisporium funariophilum]
MRRVVTSNTGVVGNHRRSVGLDSINTMGGAPPGYTSQRETASSVATLDEELHSGAVEDEVALYHEVGDGDEQEQASCSLRDHGALPSPYSTEDLHAAFHAGYQDPNQEQVQMHYLGSCAHGYTHTHSQCTTIPDLPLPGSAAPRAQPYADLQSPSFPTVRTLPSAGVATSSYQHRRPRFPSTTTTICPRRTPSHTPQARSRSRPRTTSYASNNGSNNSDPTRGVQVLTYTPANAYSYECDYGYDDDEDRLSTMNMNSTVTFLPPAQDDDAEAYSQQQPGYPRSSNTHRNPGLKPNLSRLTQATLGSQNKIDSIQTRNLSEPRPTNYVHISRKCTSRKGTTRFFPSGFFHRSRNHGKASSASSVNGTFLIDPALHIPSGLLRAMDPLPSVSIGSSKFDASHSKGDDSPGSDMKRKNVKEPTRMTNLRLEVENGSIDVDIHLMPTDSGTGTRSQPHQTRTQNFYSQPVETSVMNTPNARPPLDKRPLSQRRYGPPSLGRRKSRQHHHPHPQVSSRSPPAPPILSSGQKHQKSATTIDIRLKDAHASENHLKVKGRKMHPLIARLHAPNPRPPFNLFASTIISSEASYGGFIAPDRPTTPLVAERQGESPIMSPRSSSHSSKPTSRTRNSLSRARPSPPSTPSHVSTAPLHVHLPRTFFGPLTIHVLAGNIDAHIRLSVGLQAKAALLRESACARGYFVGELGRSSPSCDLVVGEEKDGQLEADTVEDEDDVAVKGDEVGASVSDSDSGPPVFDFPAPQGVDGMILENIRVVDGGVNNHRHADMKEGHKHNQIKRESEVDGGTQTTEEWIGDRVEVVVGGGEVLLQFVDEEEPFGKAQLGFWTRFGFGRK